MERTIQRMQGIERINFFPVRHLSPAAAYHLIKLCEMKKPKCILIEGPSDGTQLLRDIAGKEVKPPIALLAYTAKIPVDTILYPFADYSPEYQAIVWGISNYADVRFIDLPTDVSLSINRCSTIKDDEGRELIDENRREYYKITHELFESLADYSNEQNYDAYWERNFEHNLNEDVYQKSLMLQSHEMRRILEPGELENMPESASRDLVREAYMKRQIEDCLSIYQPEEIVVVTGAYHSRTLMEQTIAMTDEEINLLPRRESKLTLMPYSYYRLSSRSGYGAGNSAPAYYEMMWKNMQSGTLTELPKEYITSLGRFVRENGGYCSTANIIEAVRLSMGLASLKGGFMPALGDLHDAAVSCIGHGEFSKMAAAFASVDIGTAIGQLPEGVSQTPVQEDMIRNLKRLKLNKYKSVIAQELDLDLRENRKVKSSELAFIDLERSVFLNRLQFLQIDFAKKERLYQESATWRERWILSWTPESEIQLVETVLKGETIELAAAFTLKERLEECVDILDAADLITASYICRLTNCVETALSTFQSLTTESGSFVRTAEAAMSLSMLIQYGGIRQSDTQPLIPLLKQVFLRACLILSDAASCDDKAAAGIAAAIGTMHTISQENYALIDDEAFVKALRSLAMRDDKNPILSGLSFAVLLERNLITDEECSKEVSRRLSPGVPVSLGAGWFEGLSMRNRYALLSRIELFRELDAYLGLLDNEEFKRSVVFLRRAFGGFEPREKNGVAELLSDIWGLDKASIAVMLQAPLEEEEIEALEELEGFDFDF